MKLLYIYLDHSVVNVPIAFIICQLCFKVGGDAMYVLKCTEFEILALMYLLLIERFTLTYSLIPKNP